MGRATASPQNINIIRRVLQANGFSPVAIAASMARFSAESKFDPNALNRKDGADGSDSIGINQWNSGRARALKTFAKSPGQSGDPFDVATQAQFYANEVKGSEAKFGSKLLAAKTPDDAVQAVMGMVRPQGWSELNPTGGLGYAATLADTKRFASGDFSLRGYRGKTLTGATASDAAYLPADDRGLMQGSKSRGRTTEEGDQPLEVPDLESMGNQIAGPQQVPIDNSPSGKIGQALTGLLGFAANLNADTAKGYKKPSLFGDKPIATSQSPDVHSIVSMIQSMGR